METLRNILGLPINSEQRLKYNANAINKKISEIIVSGTKIRGFGAFSFVWEKSYVKSPTRSSDGSITNLDTYSVFVTPHLKIDFSLLFIDDYRKIMELVYSKNEHTVQCYDIVNDRTTTNNMYFSTEAMPTIYSITRQLEGDEPIIELIGVRDYVVELIGTNTKIEDKTVVYYPNLPSNVTTSIEPIIQDAKVGQEIVVGNGAEDITNLEIVDSYGQTLRFLEWNSSPSQSGAYFRNGDNKFIYDSTNLYAVWGLKSSYPTASDINSLITKYY